ncbi:PrsW family intramembrane metalloprotease [Candidatus Gracilibacteria bacterium]|nr:PrsW family intramembrane metalloprotease [Candidatus Gracilibacteria bacterium]MCF7856554.1 PrsW family intramembrane metalloprotease [Candidatus Gracilibacteria bacterium]MCF7896843.1 PrsW family intramembrane metalloprotease [Candidatus Gracilibacteria bacterium]
MRINELVVFAVLTLPPVLGWLFFWRHRLAEPEPAHVLVQLFFLGICAALPLFALREYDVFYWASPLALLIFFAFLEESLKGLLLIVGVELNRSHFDRWEDGFEFAILVALGFAFAENIFYFFREYSAGGLQLAFWNLYFFRSLGTVLAHIIFTGTFGYFYACAYVLKGIVPKAKHEKPLHRFFHNLLKVLRRPFHITRCHLLPCKDSAHGHTSGEVVIEGFLLATSLHALFNALFYFTPFDKNLGFLAVPILMGGGWWYVTRFRNTKKTNSKMF